MIFNSSFGQVQGICMKVGHTCLLPRLPQFITQAYKFSFDNTDSKV
jgi:hypothetical protein